MLRLAVSRHGDQAGMDRLAGLSQHARHRIAVAIGKTDVAEHDVGLEFARRFDALLAGMRHHHLVSATRQQYAQAFSGVRIVLDYEDSARVHDGCLCDSKGRLWRGRRRLNIAAPGGRVWRRPEIGGAL
jgi:hypothetical protein